MMPSSENHIDSNDRILKRRPCSRIAWLGVAVACWLPALASAQPAAFPGAVGQGAAATGGRGGDVYHVTNLKDYDPKHEVKIPGSLRHAIRSTEAPRTIVFDVGGAIALHAPLQLLKSDLTIAGQTAPGPGISMWGYPLKVSKASNVIVRYLRVRVGDFHARSSDGKQARSFQGNNDLDPSSANAIDIGGGSERVIFDHISASWGMDETFSVTKCRDVTVQNCLIASSLNDSYHAKGEHGYGSLVRGELTLEDQEQAQGGFTFYQNLWAHHRARNPSIGGQQKLDKGQREADRRRTDVNLINNVIYDWGDQPTHRSERGEVRVNLLGNYFINGPARDAHRVFKEGVNDRTQVYQSGNWIDSDQDASHKGFEIVTEQQIESAFHDFSDEDLLVSGKSGTPFAFIKSVAIPISPAEKAYANVVEAAGCSLVRDGADRAVIESVRARTGKLIDSQEELREPGGKLPGIDDFGSAIRPADFDTDGDGMPNEFELKHKLNPNDPADANTTALSDAGYTNLEVYLAEVAARKN